MIKTRRMLRVSQLARELNRLGFSEVPPTRKLYSLAVDSRFEAEPINNIWHVDQTNLLRIADVLGLKKARSEVT
jgi:hypothetical protein